MSLTQILEESETKKFLKNLLKKPKMHIFENLVEPTTKRYSRRRRQGGGDLQRRQLQSKRFSLCPVWAAKNRQQRLCLFWWRLYTNSKCFERGM